MTLNVVVERTDHNWGAYTLDGIGVIATTGATREEAVENFRKALKSHLELMHKEGFDTPDVTQLNLHELALV